MSTPSTSAYADAPKTGTGPGVLVLHSWFGLTEGVRTMCNDLADAGFTALAPDLFGGQTTDDPGEGEQLLAGADVDDLIMGVLSCAEALQRMPATPDEPIMVVGFSMGSSLGLWLSERRPELVSAVVGYYGTQSIDFTQTTSDYQFHFAQDDQQIDTDELALMEASLSLAGRPIDLHSYEGVGHWFAERDTPGYDPAAAAESWDRTLGFLRKER